MICSSKKTPSHTSSDSCWYCDAALRHWGSDLGQRVSDWRMGKPERGLGVNLFLKCSIAALTKVEFTAFCIVCSCVPEWPWTIHEKTCTSKKKNSLDWVLDQVTVSKKARWIHVVCGSICSISSWRTSAHPVYFKVESVAATFPQDVLWTVTFASKN